MRQGDESDKTKNVQLSANLRRKATRDEHKANLRRAEQLVINCGANPTQAARQLALESGLGERQAFRYVKAVRALYAQSLAGTPGTTLEEMITTLQAKAAACVEGDEPDWKASVKALETVCRLRGWLDRKSTVTVTGQIDHVHTAALVGEADALSDEERTALAAYHAAREKRLSGGVFTLNAPSPTGE